MKRTPVRRSAKRYKGRERIDPHGSIDQDVDEPLKKRYIRCPTCDATSKVVYTMMGSQQRVCKNGHRFVYDKWMADRIIWAPGAVGSLVKQGELF